MARTVWHFRMLAMLNNTQQTDYIIRSEQIHVEHMHRFTCQTIQKLTTFGITKTMRKLFNILPWDTKYPTVGKAIPFRLIRGHLSLFQTQRV